MTLYYHLYDPLNLTPHYSPLSALHSKVYTPQQGRSRTGEVVKWAALGLEEMLNGGGAVEPSTLRIGFWLGDLKPQNFPGFRLQISVVRLRILQSGASGF